MRVVRASAAVARAQAAWIVALEPWRGLGYRAAPLGRWLGRMARDHEVWVARAGARAPAAAIAVVQDGFLLGGFVGLLAVRPEASGAGLGSRLMEHVAARVLGRRRWLYVSCDGRNRGALRFYRRLGFGRVGRLPDLVAPGRVEILLRRGRRS
jgi:ribosomal protein S18 acetylase RimI-like enzyme